MKKDISKLKPMWDYILIEVSEPVDKLDSGIYVPISNADQAQRGEGKIIKCGSEVKDPTLKPGQLVKYPVQIGHKFNFNKKDYVLAREAGLLCTIS